MTATADERRLHFQGLLMMTARLAAKTAGLVAALNVVDERQAKGAAERARLTVEIALDAVALLRFVEEIEAGVFRGAINRDIGTKPGAIVDVPPHPAPSTPTTTPAPPSKPRPPAPTPADYGRNGIDGKAPDVMALAAKQKAEKNADPRLPREKDDE